MIKPTKEVSMTVRVKVPAEMSAADARREVRTMLKEQCWYSIDDGQLKVVSVGTEQKRMVFVGGW